MRNQIIPIVLIAVVAAWIGVTRAEDLPKNLALNKTATASSVENDDHPADKACDADEETRWCASDSSSPQWWQVDLGSAQNLSGVSIHWEFPDQTYLYVIEGSADGNAWKTLSDQSKEKEPTTAPAATTETTRLSFDAEGIRYVRIRITGGINEEHWASIYEVKVFGK